MSRSRRPANGLLWEVIAPWVRWPLHSPRRLFTVLAGLLLAAVAWHAIDGPSPASPSGADVGGAPSSSTPGHATVSPTAAVTATASSAPELTDTSPTPPGATSTVDVASAAQQGTAPPVPPGSDTTAEGFVTEWARPTLPAEQWLAGVRGYLTPELEQAMAYTDPAAVPATQVTGPARMVHVQPDGTAASFDVPTDAGTVRVDLARIEGRWLVTDLVPAASTQPGD